MHLVFIYVENYENRIQEKQYNFSSKYSVQYNKETSKLNIAKNTNPIENLFGKDLYDITAIVGKNGCGKSTLLDILFSNSFEYRDSDFWNIPILIFEDDGNLKLYLKDSFEIKTYPDINTTNFDNHFKYNDHINTSTNIVFYSNLWDQYDAFKGEDNIFNISTSNMIGTANLELYNGRNNNAYIINSFKTLELQRQIKYVLNNTGGAVKFIDKLPKNISIKLISHKNKKSYFSSEKYHSYKEQIEHYFDTLERLSIEANLTTTARVGFFTSLIYTFTLDSSQYKMIDTIAIWEYLSKALANNIPIEEIIEEIEKEDKKEEDVEQGYTITEMVNLYAKFEELLSTIVSEKGINTFSIPIDETTKNLMDKYIQSNPILPYLEFSWREMSSGEKGLLALLSRFNYLKEEQHFINANPITDTQKDMIILMDEVELYFHPEWQRKLIKILVEEVTSIFEGHKVQFIIASHSPFLISDLPRNNVIFLTNEEGLATVQEPKDLDATFGANIHNLLASSFFMKNTIGEFASDKISDVIKYVKDETPTSIDSNADAKKLINIIGEPVIKNKLLNMLTNKERSKEELIKEYQQKIDALKSK